MTTKSVTSNRFYVNELEVKLKKVTMEDDEKVYFSAIIRQPEDIYKTFKRLFEDSPVELFVVIHLKSNNRVTAFEIVSKGTLNASLVHPREVFKSAIIQNVASIVVAHNHPSGNLEPSQEDLQITKQIVEAGKILGIPLLDHVIFGENSFCSFVERGLI